MQRPLQVLHLEDHREDAELVQAMLQAEGVPCVITWRKTKSGFEEALRKHRFDVILSDYTIPGFDGLAALKFALEKAPDCPLIFVSGTLGEEAAIEALKRGATDYVLKDRPARLAEAVRRALREAADKVERRQAEAEIKRSQEQLRALAARLQAAREEERARISREMHDGLGEMLTRLDVNLVLMRKLLEQQGGQPQSPELLERVAESHSLVSGTADLVRNLCTELRPAVLDDLGLVPALEWQVRQFQARTNIRCETRFEEAAFIRNEQATSVFRIFQEILTNVARHSQASKLRIALETRGGEIFLEVKDNGRGIRPEEMADSKSLGLLGMRERASLLGGAVLIDGQVGKGTTVSVRVPLGAPA